MNTLRTIKLDFVRSRIMFILLILLLSACTNSEQALSADVVLGKTIYEANCAACHGMQGEGQPNWKQAGPDGKLPAPPHDSTGHTWHHPDGLLLEIIAQGGGAPNSDMPAYAETLTQTEMEAVLAYIKTFWDARDLEFQTQVTKQNEAR
ncbi:MAG: cytochrome c [Caldilineaceae bacterium]|nr:cytochrome c [Caldilineaceae bacterium]